MSQHKQELALIEKEAGLTRKIVRPLSAKTFKNGGRTIRINKFQSAGRYKWTLKKAPD